jgi:hypothetical protein
MRVILWGLKSQRNSFRYIWQGFFENFTRLGYETIWVNDSEKNLGYITNNSIVFAVDVASKNLKPVNGANWVLHNISGDKFKESGNVLNLQVFTNSARGEPLGSKAILWNQKSQTLYQPWGIPENPNTWLKPATRGDKEYWVGAVWNNENNQGNAEIISEYKEILLKNQIGFRKVGGTRWITRNGVSSKKSMHLINSSPIGASIVGNWQRENEYIPCRFFKNIAAGAPPSSNLDLSEILKIKGIFHNNLELLVGERLGQSKKEEIEMVKDAQEIIKAYSYENSIKRIIGMI